MFREVKIISNIQSRKETSSQIWEDRLIFRPIYKIYYFIKYGLNVCKIWESCSSDNKITLFWNMTPSILVDVHWSFEEACYLSLHSRRASANTSNHLPDYTASYPRSQYNLQPKRIVTRLRVTVDGVLDWQLDLLVLDTITLSYSVYNSQPTRSWVSLTSFQAGNHT
jgi:hypothetical protein